jgi:hypothetical protein
MHGDFLAASAVCSPFVPKNAWFWPILHVHIQRKDGKTGAIKRRSPGASPATSGSSQFGANMPPTLFIHGVYVCCECKLLCACACVCVCVCVKMREVAGCLPSRLSLLGRACILQLVI